MSTNNIEIANNIGAIEALPDRDLYNLCKEYGGNAKDWLKKFAGLLPEVYRRRLYKKHGCISIHEFAKKLSGMNEETVNKVLNLHRKLLETPLLLNLLTSGEVGWSKMEKIAGIANKENEMELAEKVKNLPSSILRVYVKKQKKISAGGEEENDLNISQAPGTAENTTGELNDENKALYMSDHRKLNFSLSPKTESKLRYIKSSLEQKNTGPLSWNQIFAMWPYQAGKETILIKICPECAKRKGQSSQSRHIPMDVRRIIKSKYDDHCAVPGCPNAIAEFHHLKRHSLEKDHDPDFIVPLCKNHHDLVHAGLIRNEDDPVEKWQIGDAKNANHEKTFVDARVRKYKNLHSQK